MPNLSIPTMRRYVEPTEAAGSDPAEADNGPTISVPLFQLAACNGATFSAEGDDLLLLTSPRQHEFSAFGVFELPDIERISCRVEVALQVFSGELHVGWYEQDHQRWAASRTAKEGKHILQLIVPAGTSGGQFIIQNRTPDGPARVLLEKIFIFRDTPVRR